MRILVLGAGGQLGRELARGLREVGHEVATRERREVDITDEVALTELVGRGGYQRVINCAAYTKVDQAESEPELAFSINRDGARNVGLACLRAGVALCHISTDFVFTQEPLDPLRPWTELDIPQPRGVYAESKRAGELECLALGGPLFLVRTAWLYGTQGPNFPLAICRAAAERGRVRVVADQVGSPTWTGDLVPALGELLEGDSFGLYHLTSSGSTTWFHFAQAVLRDVGILAQVEPTTTAEWGAAAPRPRYSVLSNGRWRELGMAALPAWEQSLRGYIGSELEGAFAAFDPPQDFA
ncbi:MAG: dTDP-4-dehydrorhamnose reductase [Candidatus Dormibacteria bacterium]